MFVCKLAKTFNPLTPNVSIYFISFLLRNRIFQYKDIVDILFWHILRSDQYSVATGKH